MQYRTNRLENNILNISLISFVLFHTISVLLPIPKIVNDAFLMVLGSICLVVCCHKGIYKCRELVYFTVLYTFFGLICSIYNGNADPQEMLWPVAFFSMGYALLVADLNAAWCRNLYYVVIMLFSVVIVFLWNEYINSRFNSIGSVLLLAYSMYVISLKNKRVSLFATVLPLVVLFFAIHGAHSGRASLLTFMWLLFAQIWLFLKEKKSVLKRLIQTVIFILICLSLIFIINSSNIKDIVVSKYHDMTSRGLESTRTEIWHDYGVQLFSAKTPIANIFFGAKVGGTELLEHYSENLHNSFLNLYSKYGLFMVMYVVFLMLHAGYYFKKKKNSQLLILLIALFIRMSLDYTNFNSLLDSIFVYLVFYPYWKGIQCKGIENAKASN